MSTKAPLRRSAYNLSLSKEVRRDAIAAIYHLSNESGVFETLKSVAVFGFKRLIEAERRDLLITFLALPEDWYKGEEPTYLMLTDAHADLLREAHTKLEEVIDKMVAQPLVISFAVHLARDTLERRATTE